MSLLMVWALCRSYPSQVLNGLALLLALAGGWLLLATRWRVRRLAAVLGEGARAVVAEESLDGGGRERLNRFFYVFGGLSLGAALALSWFSTTLSTFA